MPDPQDLAVAVAPPAEFPIHPLATLFPPMSEKEFDALLEDLRAHGQREPIWTHQGQVIDGRNRLLACQKLGIAPKTREWDGDGSLLEFVISLNLRRRHLKERQRAMIAARLKPAFEEEARNRQGNAGKPLQANWPEGQSRDLAGKLLNVSGRSVERASKVLEKGIPELIAAVDACKLAVSTAAALAEFPEEEQARLLAAGRAEIAQALRGETPATPPAAPAPEPVTAPTPVAPAPPVPINTGHIEMLLLTPLNECRGKIVWGDNDCCVELADSYIEELCSRTHKGRDLKHLIENGVRVVRAEG